MIEDKSQGKLEAVKEAARKMGPEAETSLKACLERFANYTAWGKYETTCYIYADFAPHSLYFELMMDEEGTEERILNGGIIYSGPGLPLSGGAPSFTVSLDDDAAGGKRHMWSIHT